jgi:putative ABC transport system ATP-binding protein
VAKVVQVKKVSKSFHQGGDAIHALKEVNFDCTEGSITMIVGPSGSGKTTLLSCIAGVLDFDQGEIDVMGHSLHAMTQAEITLFRKRHIGFIFQLFNLIPTLTTEENIAIPLILNGMSDDEAEKKARQLLNKMGLEGRGKERPQNLSGGQQQRVAIARALVHEPTLVICDEPTASLDAETGAKIMELLVSVVKHERRSAIIVTHDNRIFKYADVIVKMEDGVILENHVSA